jgi:hypothetical protein
MKQMLIRAGTGVLALLIAIGLTAAAGGASTRPERLGVAAHDLVRPGSSSASCVEPSAMRSKPLRNAQAAKSALHSYDDYIEDVMAAPDICAANIVTNDNQVITIGMHAHDRTAFAEGDAYSVYLDTDSNAATGTTPESGVPAGAEYAIDITDQASTLRHWNGTAFDPISTQTPIVTEWVDGYGPALEIARADLGDPQSFSLVYVTTNGVDHDLAPDTGMWPYTVSPFALTASRVVVATPRAGKVLVAGMEVTRSDFDIALDEGTITCRAKLVGKNLAGRGLFAGDLVACGWRIPKNARGKRVAGTVSVTFQGVTAKRSFNVRVR